MFKTRLRLIVRRAWTASVYFALELLTEAIENSSTDRKEEFHRILLAICFRLSRESYRGVKNSSAPSATSEQKRSSTFAC